MILAWSLILQIKLYPQSVELPYLASRGVNIITHLTGQTIADQSLLTVLVQKLPSFRFVCLTKPMMSEKLYYIGKCLQVCSIDQKKDHASVFRPWLVGIELLKRSPACHQLCQWISQWSNALNCMLTCIIQLYHLKYNYYTFRPVLWYFKCSTIKPWFAKTSLVIRKSLLSIELDGEIICVNVMFVYAITQNLMHYKLCSYACITCFLHLPWVVWSL